MTTASPKARAPRITDTERLDHIAKCGIVSLVRTAGITNDGSIPVILTTASGPGLRKALDEHIAATKSAAPDSVPDARGSADGR